MPESLYRAVDEGLPTFIDLSEATFLDTVTLGIILEAVRRSRRSRRDVLIYLPDSTAQQVRDLFRITGFADVLPVIRDWGTTEARAG